MSAERVYSFASTVVGALRALGAIDFVISPGSRSTPLALSLAKFVPNEHLHVVVDERSASFVALGLSRVTGTPTVLVCTSGSAVAHYHAAVIEADLAEIPLIVLSSDRPVELVRSGASQTIDQDKIFGTSVRSFVELGAPDEREDRAIVAAVTRAYAAATRGDGRQPPGPVHMNVRFRKPLEPPADFFTQTDLAVRVPSLTRASLGLQAPTRDLIASFSQEPVTVVVGAMPYGDARGESSEALRASVDRAILAGHLVLTEPASGVVHRGAFDVSHAMRCEGFRRTPAGRVLLLGHPSIEPKLEGWLATADERVIVATSGLFDPEGRATRAVTAEPREVLDALAAPPTSHRGVAVLAASRSRLVEAVGAQLGGDRPLTEPGVSTALARGLGEASLVLGNSLAIRDFGRYATPFADERMTIHHQRGHAGIDGMIAGTVGVRRATRANIPVVALLGDVTFAHDVGSLALLAEAAAPLVVVVLQNGGGKIFDRLPIARAGVPEEIFERLYLTRPRINLAAVSRAFGVESEDVSSQAEFERSFRGALAVPRATVILAAIDLEADRVVREALEAVS